MARSVTLTDTTFSSPRHTAHYWEAGATDGPSMIFLHGWPEIGLAWRAQMEAFASEGWHCIAPDMRGYGGSSAPTTSEADALKEIVDDMVELHDHLGASPAIWIGHDLGSPAVGALAAIMPVGRGRADLAKRARIIVRLADGASYADLIRLSESSRTIAKWKQGFLEGRVAGLAGRYRGNTPTVLTPALEARILAWTRSRSS